jgi:TolB-like protein
LAKAILGDEAELDLSQVMSVREAETVVGQIVGTPGYMSPEQARAQRVDQRVDIWALGCVFYELLTGRRAFRGGTLQETIQAVLEGEPDWHALPAATPVELKEILRKCLEKDPSCRPQKIEDVRVALEAVRLGTSKSGKRPRRWLFSMAAVILALGAFTLGIRGFRKGVTGDQSIQSLAVLPLENLSHDSEQDYFAEGMTDELITALAKISALRVVSRTSVVQYRDTKKPVSVIARELGVDALVEGAVLRSNNQVRITAQLIRASPEQSLWAEKYEGSLDQVLSLQDAVAQAVASAIQVKLTPQERTLLTTPKAVDPEAYEDYLKARHFWELSGEENLQKSADYFEKTTTKDPGYALAWAGLADTYNYLGAWGVLPEQDARPRARAAAERALALDKSLVGPVVTLASVKADYEWDWAGTERLCKQAIEMNPGYGNAHHTYATYLAELGRTKEAVAEARRARDVEPLSAVYSANVAWKLYLDRQYEQAELEWRKSAPSLAPLDPSYVGASIYLQVGRQKQAIVDLQKGVIESHRSILELSYLAHGLGVTGDRAGGHKVLEEMLALATRRHVRPDSFGIAYEGLGERQKALEWFEKAYSEHSINGWMLPDPRLDGIRTEPRFKAILRGMRLPN